MRKKALILCCILLSLGGFIGCAQQKEVKETPKPAEMQEEKVNEYAFYVEDESGKRETIYSGSVTKNAKTPRGVGIGDSLSELEAAYSELRYESEWMPDAEGPDFNRVYLYLPEGSRTYIAFFLLNKEIVMMEIVDGIDFIPGKDISSQEILGRYGVFKESNNISAKGQNISYILQKKNGEEEPLIDFYARSVYEEDIDDDGITEVLVYLPGGDFFKIGIYDFIDGKTSYIDVNEKTGSYYSTGMENMANLKPEYKKCIEVGFTNEDGTKRTEIYKVKDNELIYVCPFTNEVLM